MKRSELIKNVATKFEEYANNQQYKGFSNEGLIEVILQLVEDEGMLAPTREFTTKSGSTIEFNEWEPE